MKFKNALAVFLVLVLLTPHATGQFANYTEKQIKAVAVVSGENRGTTINISVIVTPGTGRVFVSVSPFTEIDMQGSAQLAALTACDLTGNDFLKHDFFYIIEAKSAIVGGPSAGAVMTVATVAALENLTLRDDVYMTGMIYPDGSIGPVGGIKYKLEAAAEDGAKVFLIPKGQRYEKVLETEKIQKGPFLVISSRTKTVDLVKYGESLGVRVVEVENITEALRYYAGVGLKQEVKELEAEKYADLMKTLAERMKKDAMDLYSEFEKVADSEIKSSVDEKLRKAEEYYRQGYYYSSTSMYFTAKILMRKEIYRHKVNDDASFSVETEVIREEIESAKRVAKSYEMGLASFQIVGAAEERLAKAEDYLEKAITANNWEEAITNLALAKERLESAKVWMSLLPEIKKDTKMKPDEIKRRADFYLSMAESLLVYADKIGGARSLLYGDDSAEESLKLAEKLYNSGHYAGTVFSAIDSMVKSAISIEVLAIRSDDELYDKINASERSAENAICIAEKYTVPVLPYAYYEFGKTSEGIWKLYYYKLSERIAKTLVNIAGKENVRLVKVKYKPPELKITPDVQTVAEKQIEKILAIPGFESTVAITAILASTAVLRKGWRKN